MRRLLALAPLLALPVFGCADDDYDPGTFELEASPAGYPTMAGSPGMVFGVGLRSELVARDQYGSRHWLKAVTCIAGCRVEALPSTDPPVFPSFRLTPLATKLTVRATVLGAPDVTFDRELTAVETKLGGLHDGAGPGIAFLTGMTIAWRLRPNAEDVAWEPALSEVSITGPFEIVDRRGTGVGGISVRFRARAPGRGTLVHRNGAVEESYSIQAFAPADVRTLHAAEARLNTFVSAGSLRDVITERLEVRTTTPTKAWVVFETSTGELGIGGAGESLPAPGAVFDFARPYSTTTDPEPPTLQELRDQPQLVLEAKAQKEVRTSKLLLRIGDVTGSVDVEVK